MAALRRIKKYLYLYVMLGIVDEKNIVKEKTAKRLILTPKWLESINDDLGEDFVRPFLKEGETQITLHELLVRASLSDAPESF